MKVNSYAEKKETGTLASHGLMTAEASIIARIHVQRYLLSHGSGDKLAE